MKTPQRPRTDLSRRERQIMDIVYRGGRVTAADVNGRLPDPPSYSAVRALLRILERKGHVRHELDGTRYVYLPVVAKHSARRSALRDVVETFFEGSTEMVVAALLDRGELSDGELARLSALIEQARKEGR
jgi:predicted transcriptional regulator